MIFKIADFLSPDLYLMEYINIFQLMRPKTWWSQNRTVIGTDYIKRLKNVLFRLHWEEDNKGLYSIRSQLNF